jgi:hypothetical protein
LVSIKEDYPLGLLKKNQISLKNGKNKLVPAKLAVIKLEIEPVSKALNDNFAIIDFLFGTIAPKIPTWIATDPKFAKLHNA